MGFVQIFKYNVKLFEYCLYNQSSMIKRLFMGLRSNGDLFLQCVFFSTLIFMDNILSLLKLFSGGLFIWGSD